MRYTSGLRRYVWIFSPSTYRVPPTLLIFCRLFASHHLNTHVVPPYGLIKIKKSFSKLLFRIRNVSEISIAVDPEPAQYLKGILLPYLVEKCLFLSRRENKYYLKRVSHKIVHEKELRSGYWQRQKRNRFVSFPLPKNFPRITIFPKTYHSFQNDGR